MPLVQCRSRAATQNRARRPPPADCAGWCAGKNGDGGPGIPAARRVRPSCARSMRRGSAATGSASGCGSSQPAHEVSAHEGVGRRGTVAGETGTRPRGQARDAPSGAENVLQPGAAIGRECCEASAPPGICPSFHRRFQL